MLVFASEHIRQVQADPIQGSERKRNIEGGNPRPKVVHGW